MKACPFCGAEARRSIAPAKGYPMGTYIATIRCGNPHCAAEMHTLYPAPPWTKDPRAAGKAGDRETVEQKVWEWMNT